MNILVLGGSGFLGTRLVETLLEHGHRVSMTARGITPDAFGNRVERIRADRTDDCAMKRAFRGKAYDVVYDNLAYGARDVSIALDAISCGLYVMTSSAAVYTLHPGLTEEEFRPEMQPPVYKEISSYAEGKRSAESCLAWDYPSQKAISVRFPVLLGPEDPTRRLHFHVEHLLEKRPMKLDTPNSRMSFIHVEEAARVLAFLADRHCRGPLNAASNGAVSLREILSYLESKTGKTALLQEKGDKSPYNGMGNYSLCTDRAQTLGFPFSHVRDWIFPLLDSLMASMLSGK